MEYIILGFILGIIFKGGSNSNCSSHEIVYCKSPTYPAPPRPGTNDTSRLDEIFKRG